MAEDNNMTNETMAMTTQEENTTEESRGLPVGLIIAGVLAGGAAAFKGLTWIGGKLFKRKKYAEPPVRLVKDTK